MHARGKPKSTAAATAAALLVFSILAGGCSFSTNFAGPGSRNVVSSYLPRPGSPAFNNLHLEKTDTVVILKISGDDVRLGMEAIAETLIKKGYAVRDVGMTARELQDANLLRFDPGDPEMIEKAAQVFKEKAAIAGKIETISLKPIRVSVELGWYDLASRKKLWTIKSSFTGQYLFGVQNHGRAVFEIIRKSLAPLPSARP